MLTSCFTARSARQSALRASLSVFSAWASSRVPASHSTRGMRARVAPAARCTAAVARGFPLSGTAGRLQAARVARSAHASAASTRESVAEPSLARLSSRRPRSSARSLTTCSRSEFSACGPQASTRSPAARAPASARVRFRAAIAQDSIRRLARTGAGKPCFTGMNLGRHEIVRRDIFST
jgi:hypothetical protein